MEADTNNCTFQSLHRDQIRLWVCLLVSVLCLWEAGGEKVFEIGVWSYTCAPMSLVCNFGTDCLPDAGSLWFWVGGFFFEWYRDWSSEGGKISVNLEWSFAWRQTARPVNEYMNQKSNLAIAVWALVCIAVKPANKKAGPLKVWQISQCNQLKWFSEAWSSASCQQLNSQSYRLGWMQWKLWQICQIIVYSIQSRLVSVRACLPLLVTWQLLTELAPRSLGLLEEPCESC